jgi:hypothetical protein
MALILTLTCDLCGVRGSENLEEKFVGFNYQEVSVGSFKDDPKHICRLCVDAFARYSRTKLGKVWLKGQKLDDTSGTRAPSNRIMDDNPSPDSVDALLASEDETFDEIFPPEEEKDERLDDHMSGLVAWARNNYPEVMDNIPYTVNSLKKLKRESGLEGDELSEAWTKKVEEKARVLGTGKRNGKVNQ